MRNRWIRLWVGTFVIPVLGFVVGYILGGLPTALQALAISAIPVLILHANRWAGDGPTKGTKAADEDARGSDGSAR
ncbi:hypothetical protein SAMN04487916_111114 [Arthrobacter sp. ov407]|nr:hypothetical protein SAMN04487916_111114 [Arthrobacter sp. ov407]